jgi:hypothetical protein
VNDFLSSGHRHGGVVKRPTEVHLLVADMLEADQRIIRGHLSIVAVPVRLREAIQLASAEAIGAPMPKHLRHMGYMRAPVVMGGSLGSKDFKVRRDALSSMPQTL